MMVPNAVLRCCYKGPYPDMSVCGGLRCKHEDSFDMVSTPAVLHNQGLIITNPWILFIFIFSIQGQLPIITSAVVLRSWHGKLCARLLLFILLNKALV